MVLLYACLLIPFFEPRSLGLFVSDSITHGFYWARFVSAGVILIMCIRRRRIDTFSVLGLSVPLMVCLSVFLNSGFEKCSLYAQWVYDWMPLAVGVLVVAVARRKDLRALLWSILIITSILSVVNTGYTFMFPGGLSAGGEETYMFYGHKNVSIHFIALSVGTSAVLAARSPYIGIARTLLLYVLGVYQCVVAYSATSMLALVLLGVMLLLALNGHSRKYINGLYGVIAYGALFVAFVVLRLQTVFAPIVEDVLHKSLTFTGRTYVWDGVISMMHGPNLLYGYGTAPRFHLLFNEFRYSHPHNELLSVFLSGGLIALLLYVTFVLMACYALFKNRSSLTASIWSAVVIAFMVIAFAEPFYSISWGLALAIGYYGASSGTSRQVGPMKKSINTDRK